MKKDYKLWLTINYWIIIIVSVVLFGIALFTLLNGIFWNTKMSIVSYYDIKEGAYGSYYSVELDIALNTIGPDYFFEITGIDITPYELAFDNYLLGIGAIDSSWISDSSFSDEFAIPSSTWGDTSTIFWKEQWWISSSVEESFTNVVNSSPEGTLYYYPLIAVDDANGTWVLATVNIFYVTIFFILVCLLFIFSSFMAIRGVGKYSRKNKWAYFTIGIIVSNIIIAFFIYPLWIIPAVNVSQETFQIYQDSGNLIFIDQFHDLSTGDSGYFFINLYTIPDAKTTIFKSVVFNSWFSVFCGLFLLVCLTLIISFTFIKTEFEQEDFKMTDDMQNYGKRSFTSISGKK